MKLSEVDRNKLAPMMKHYVELKDNYPDVILLYRLGDFYEMFFEDAEIVSHELELTLTGRNAGLEERVPMCGVPHHAVDIYVDKLVKKGFKVAICEQLEDPKNSKGIVKRDVTEVISSGTIVNSNSLDEKTNNYIGSIYDYEYCYCIVYTDITTGELYSEIITHDTNKLINEILSFGLSEVIVNSIINPSIPKLLKNQYKLTVTITDNILDNDDYIACYRNVTDLRYVTAIKHLLYYLVYEQKRTLSHLQKVIINEDDNFLKMDIHTKRNLELTESLRLKDRNYSLLWLLDNTKTAMGSRKLRQWIEAPLKEKRLIEKRYNIVSKLIEEFILAEDLRRNLYEVYDLERLSGRVAMGNANARDLIQLKNSLKVLPIIKEMLNTIHFYSEIDPLESLYQLLDESIYEEPPVGLKEGYLIKEGYSKELDELKDLRSGGKNFISKFELEEKERTGIKNLKIGFNKVFGYYIEISKGNLNLITDDMGYIRKQTLANCERFITPLLKEKEDLILSAEEKIINLEYELFIEIRDKVKKYIPKLQKQAKAISEIDVLQSFAYVSEKYHYVRPTITLDHSLKLIESRHPVVERVIKEEYVPNDIIMDNGVYTLLITGPNMAGKSTYMRQLGIIAIMAQIGCFVPAKEAKMPVFDQIFTRIGASDDLVSGESTFMVEMIEATNAINNATKSSLILFDELGRGTATYDGMSLAQSILEYTNNRIGCKTLFSTHYHELTKLEKELKHLKNKHVSATETEDGENLIFLHKVKDGSVDKSYGINVAKLAGLPTDIITRASEILATYEEQEKNHKEISIQTSLPLEFISKKSEIEEILKNTNVLELTPINALNLLYELKEKLK
ncbi:MAG: DNA mismatch repair protein MutS [Erysipelotrichaceae bacterium]|nr:DNA mismatch repair protein MutS [Erysipelotrichaceae bacterium]